MPRPQGMVGSKELLHLYNNNTDRYYLEFWLEIRHIHGLLSNWSKIVFLIMKGALLLKLLLFEFVIKGLNKIPKMIWRRVWESSGSIISYCD